jgi:hypothetical protein
VHRMNTPKLRAVVPVLACAVTILAGCSKKPERISGVFEYVYPDPFVELTRALSRLDSSVPPPQPRDAFDKYDFRADGSVIYECSLLEKAPPGFYVASNGIVTVHNINKIFHVEGGLLVTNFATNVFRTEGTDLVMVSERGNDQEKSGSFVGKRYLRKGQ